MRSRPRPGASEEHQRPGRTPSLAVHPHTSFQPPRFGVSFAPRRVPASFAHRRRLPGGLRRSRRLAQFSRECCSTPGRAGGWRPRLAPTQLHGCGAGGISVPHFRVEETGAQGRKSAVPWEVHPGLGGAQADTSLSSLPESFAYCS